MNIVLIGYRGTSKTVVGRKLADKLGMTYVGMDDEIVRRAGKPIPQVVEESGWEHFRDLESEVVRESAARDNCILDTGGGAILRAENVDHLRRNGLVFWLQASIPDIVSRIGGDDQRPSLTGTKSFTAEVAEVLAERTPKYAAAAHETVDTSALTIDERVEHISEVFRAQSMR